MPASSTTMAGGLGIPRESRLSATESRLSWRRVAAVTATLQIVRAYYGLNNRTNDVTQLLRGMVRNGTLNVQVNNNNMGGDPAKAATKCSRSSIATKDGSKLPRSKRETRSEFREGLEQLQLSGLKGRRWRREKRSQDADESSRAVRPA